MSRSGQLTCCNHSSNATPRELLRRKFHDVDLTITSSQDYIRLWEEPEVGEVPTCALCLFLVADIMDWVGAVGIDWVNSCYALCRFDALQPVYAGDAWGANRVNCFAINNAEIL